MVMKVCALIAFAVLANAAPVAIRANDANLQYIGRFADGSSNGDPAKMFDMPGCEIRASMDLSAAATVTVMLAQRHSVVPPQPSGNTKNSHFQENAFVVYVDGTRQGVGGYNATFTTDKNQTEQAYAFNISTSPLAKGVHNIRIVKATEAQWNGGSPTPNYMTFTGFNVNAAGEDETAALNVRTVAAPPLPTRKIEFLGDSITAGFCNECKTPDPVPNTHREAYGATWDYQIGKILNAQVHTAAWSGLGMVHNCCGGNTTMPSIFSRTLATVNTDNTWDWKSWQADALVINLGTNDGGAATDPKAHYTNTYSQVVMDAFTHYGPDVHVFLACGPMSDHYCDPIQAVIKNVTARGVKAHFLDQRGFLNGTFGPSCCGHPSIEVDTAMATNGAAFIKTTLGW
jgi:hypothetical protein